MVRTKSGSAFTKAGGAKSVGKSSSSAPMRPIPRIVFPTDSKTKSREASGGNTYCPRETPEWQQPITTFFRTPNESGEIHAPKPRKKDFAVAGPSSAPDVCRTSSDAQSVVLDTTG